MKLVFKLAIIGATLVGAGAGVTAVGTAIASMNKEGDSRILIRDEQKTINAESNLTLLSLSSVEDDIGVSFSDDATGIEIKYYDTKEENQGLYTVEKGTTSLELNVKKNYWMNFSHITWPWNVKDELSHTIDVVIPSSMENLAVVVSSISGDININNDSTTTANIKSLKLNTVSSDVRADSFVCKEEMVANSTSGDVRMSNAESKESSLVASSTSGELIVSKAKIKGKAELSTTSGDVIIDTLECETLKASSVSGEVSIKKLDIEKTVTASSLSGDVKIGLVDSRDNYSIDVSTLSGSTNVNKNADSSKPKSIKASTTSGDIVITFGE